MNKVMSLEVRLGNVRVGYLTHYPDEKTLFVVSDEFLDLGPSRPILSLSMARPGDEERTRALLRDELHKSASIKAPPFFSNLLPEGGLRARIAQRLKTHEDREFLLLAALGHDLPGAVVLAPMDTPDHLLVKRGEFYSPAATELAELKFSLGGMQMKFSMLRQGERYTLNTGSDLGDYIVKPPSRDFEALPNVEAATMNTARVVGIDVPEVALIQPDDLDGLPDMSGYPREQPFYAIRRFDRIDGGRRHAEDFAQVFNLRSLDKYGKINYDMIARALLTYAGGLADLKEMTRRLVLNILLGNGDAHIKNWSLIYDDPRRPRLSPAYDLVSTVAYMEQDTAIALNMAGVKRFNLIGLDTFAAMFDRIDLLPQRSEELLEEVRSTTRGILATWQAQFAAANVPERLIRKIVAHIADSKLAKVR